MLREAEMMNQTAVLLVMERGWLSPVQSCD